MVVYHIGESSCPPDGATASPASHLTGLILPGLQLTPSLPLEVIFKLAETATAEAIAEFVSLGRAMVGAVPGLVSMELGPCLPGTLHRSQGYDFGLVAILEKASDLPVRLLSMARRCSLAGR